VTNTRTRKIRSHAFFALTLAGAGLLWRGAVALTPLAGATEAGRYGSLAGLALGAACALLGYTSLLWAGREGADASATNRRVVGVYVVGVLLRIVIIFGSGLALWKLAGLDVAVVLVTAVAGYIPLSFVEVALLARIWDSERKRPDLTGGESADG